MPFPEELVAWFQNNKEKVFRYIVLLQALLGLFLMAFGYYAGRSHFQLIRQGARTQGEIIGHVQERFRDSRRNTSSTAFMPVVEFRQGDRLIHFQDWLGSSSTGNLHNRVTVLYNPADPAVAMIDRQVMNWIPWAPCFAVGVFLLLVALKNSLRSMSA